MARESSATQYRGIQLFAKLIFISFFILLIFLI
jgi:hypothetical protein